MDADQERLDLIGTEAAGIVARLSAGVVQRTVGDVEVVRRGLQEVGPLLVALRVLVELGQVGVDVVDGRVKDRRDRPLDRGLVVAPFPKDALGECTVAARLLQVLGASRHLRAGPLENGLGGGKTLLVDFA